MIGGDKSFEICILQLQEIQAFLNKYFLDCFLL